MHRLAFALCCLIAVTPRAFAETAPPAQVSVAGRPSDAACDSTRIGARELSDCLRAASDKSEHELTGALEGAQKSIEGRPKVLGTRKTRWKRFLTDAQAQWSSWRDAECQDLAPLETAAASGDPRLACIIDFNTRRAADLRARYPG